MPEPQVKVRIPRLEEKPTGPRFDAQQQKDMGESLLYSVMFDISAGTAYTAIDHIRSEVSKLGEPVWRGWLDAWNDGVLAYENAMLRSKQVMGNATEEDLTRIEGIKTEKELKGLLIPKTKPKNIADKAVRLAAQMSPLMLKGMEGGLKRGLAFGVTAGSMAAIIGQAGPQAALPEELITVPGAAMGGFQVGMVSGTLENIMMAEAGYAYEELLNLGVDPQISRAAAGGVGIVNGLLELAQIKVLLDTIPGGRLLLRKAMTAGIRQALKKKTLKNLAVKYGKQYAGAVTKETAQEVAQESTNIIMEAVAKELHKAMKYEDIDHATIKEITDRLLETAEESALAFGVMALPGTVAKAGIEAAPELGERGSVEIGGRDTSRIKTFRSWVKAKGGISQKDPGWHGEITAAAKGARWQPGVVSGKGMWVDEAVLQARADGWDIKDGDDLLNALTEDRERGTFTEGFEDMLDRLDAERIEGEVEEHGWEYSEREIEDINRRFEEEIQSESSAPISGKDLSDLKKYQEGTLKFYEKRRAKPRPRQASFIKTPRQREAALHKEKRDILKEATVPGDKKGAKQRIRIVSGQYKVGELMIPESKALEASFKKAEQAARIAMREGKKEGIDIGKVKIEALKGKQKARIAKLKLTFDEYKLKVKERATKKRLRDYTKKLAKQITQPIPKSVDFWYAEAIRTLTQDIDPDFRMDKTLNRRDRTRQFLERSPKSLKDMPRKLMAELAQKPLNDITINDLERIKERRDFLIKLGKNILEYKKVQRTRRLSKDRDEMVDNVLAGEGLVADKSPIVENQKVEGTVRKVFSRAFHQRFVRVFDILDGGKLFKGKIHQVYYDQVNRAYNKYLIKCDERLDRGAAKLKELGIKINELAKTRTFKGVVDKKGKIIKFSTDAMIDVYIGVKNPLKAMAIEFGNNIDVPLQKRIIAALEPKYKALGDFILTEYDDNYLRQRKEYIRMENTDSGYEKFYSPIKREDFERKYIEQEITDEILHRKGLRKKYAEKGNMLKRVDIPEQFQQKIKLGAYEMWSEMVPKQEHLFHYGQIIKDLHRLNADPTFRAAIRQQFSNEYVKALEHYVDLIADPDIYKSFNSWENLSREIRKNVALAYLAYNLVTMSKQGASIFLIMDESGPINLTVATAKFIADPVGLTRWVKEDPQMKHRSLERELEELKKRDKNRYLRVEKALGKFGMKGIVFFDMCTVAIGYKGVYDKNVRKLGPALAREEAQKAILRAQEVGTAKDMAWLYTSNEMLNWFTQFTSQLNQIYGKATHDLPSLVKNKQYAKAFGGYVGIALSATAVWIASNRRLPEDADDWWDVFTEQGLAMIPIVGKQICSYSQGWQSSGEISLFLAARTAGLVLTNAKAKRKLNAVIETIAVARGWPYIGGKRLVTGEPLGPEKKKKKGGM